MEGQVVMSMKETNRVTVLEKLKHKQIKQKQAASILDLSVRQVRRLARRYEREGVRGLAHKLRGLPSCRRMVSKRLDLALSIVRQKYADFGPTLAHEKLVSYYGIDFSRETLRKAMVEVGMWHAKPRKYIILHQMRERRNCEGELIIVDGSPHAWFENRGSPCTILVFIDDATGKLKHLEFAQSESTNAYFLATRHYLEVHGKPLALYLDKHGVFRVNTNKGGISSVADSNGDTQFGRAMRELGIELIFANTPQAKGRVERVNQTLQDRLVKELRLKGIDNMTEGNLYLSEFVDYFNSKFAVVPKQKTDLHRPIASTENLEEILCQKHIRLLSKQLTFQYENLLYQIKTKRPSYALRYAKVTVRESINGEISVDYKGTPLDYTILKRQPKANIIDSKHLNLIVDKIVEKQFTNMIRIPALDHPWRQPFIYAKNMSSL